MGSIVEEQISTDQINSTHNYNNMIDSNWVITNGSFTNSITVESSDYPLPESDSNDPTHYPPLLLQPVEPDSGPCEIKLCFEGKCEIRQIYVRSSARVYEIYYARSAQSSNEYLCTVRCNIAERDDKVLQTALIKDVSGESGGSVGGTSVNSDDDWVKIKGYEFEVGRSSFSDDASSNKGKNTQDLYEATVEITDADPCSSITIRLLSLQDKSHVYVDDVYIYVEPADSTDSETEVPALSASPLMAMFMPTLMQLSATGLNRAKDKHASDESHKDDNARKDQVDQQYFKLKEPHKDTTESVEIHQPQIACNTQKCDESGEVNVPLGRLERSLEQLLSRVSAVEDICLRFEEKMLKPIQSMEARLQHVENELETGLEQIENKLETRLQQVELQMEKFCKNIQNSDLPRCTRISAPAFSCSESNSSSFYDEGRNHTISNEPEIEKKDIRPGLVVTVPEFLCGEDEDNSDQKELEDTPCTIPNKTLSVDDALAAALSGFLSTAKIQHNVNAEKDSGLSNEDEETKHIAIDESFQIDAQELSGAEDSMKESLSYTQILSITAPDFTAEEIGDDGVVNHNRASSDSAFGYKNYDYAEILSIIAPGLTAVEIGDDEVVNNNHSSYETALITDNGTNDPEVKKVLPSTQDKSLFTSTDSCDLNINESVDGLESEGNDSLSSGEVHFNGISTNLIESSRSSSLDYNFPILEVKFTSDAYASLNNPLKALLDGEVEWNVQAPIYDGSVHGDTAANGNTDQINVVSWGSNGTAKDILVDIGCLAADGSLNMDVKLENSCTTPSSPEMTVSLI